jgi:hypothetical protein
VHAILVSVGSGGDILPFLQLGKRLKERGHQATLITHCCYQKTANDSRLGFVSLDSESEYHAFIDDQPLLNTPRGIPEFLRRHTLPKVPLDVQHIVRQISSPDTVVLTRDLFDLAPRFISEQLGLPLIWVFMNPSQITTWRLRAELFGNILASDVDGLRSSLGLPPVTKHQNYWSTYPNGIALWPEWFAPVTCSSASNVVSVGL